MFRLQQGYRAIREQVHGTLFLKRQLPRYRHRTPLFQHVNIQTNNRCTRRCPFCYHGLVKAITPCFISEELFQKTIQELHDLDFSGRVSLYEMNEPLTDKRIFALLRYTRDYLPQTLLFLATNGDLLTESVGQALFDNGLDLLHVNSYDPAALARNASIVRNLRRQGHRVIHIPQLFKRGWRSRAGHLRQHYQSPVKAPCELVYKQIVIKPDGTVCSCSHDFFNQNEMGNVAATSLKAIWFGEKFERLRHRLADGRRSQASLCRQCDYKGYGDHIRIKRL